MSELNGSTVEAVNGSSAVAEDSEAKAKREQYEAIVADMQAKYPGVELASIISKRAGLLVLRCPEARIWAEFIDTATKDKASKALAMKSYVLQSTVYPAKPEAAAILARLPALGSKGSELLNEMAGQGDGSDIVIKKH
jgi:hypothetical protein